MYWLHAALSFDMSLAMFQKKILIFRVSVTVSALKVSVTFSGRCPFWEEQLLVAVVFLSNNHTSSE